MSKLVSNKAIQITLLILAFLKQLQLGAAGVVRRECLNLSYTVVKIKSNCVKSLDSPSLLHCPWATQLLSKKMQQRCLIVGTTVFDLNGLRFEPHKSYSRDKRITA